MITVDTADFLAALAHRVGDLHDDPPDDDPPTPRFRPGSATMHVGRPGLPGPLANYTVDPAAGTVVAIRGAFMTYTVVDDVTEMPEAPEPDPFYVDPTGEGLTLADCPHRPGTPEANAWAHAWGNAEADRRQADGSFGASQLDRARACKLASGVEDGGRRVFGRGYLEPDLAYDDDRVHISAAALTAAFAQAAGAMQSFAVHAAAVDRILKAGALGALSLASWTLGPPVDPTYTPPPPASRPARRARRDPIALSDEAALDNLRDRLAGDHPAWGDRFPVHGLTASTADRRITPTNPY